MRAAPGQRARQFLAEVGLLDDEPQQAACQMPTIVYDTGALLAAERRNPDFLALHDELTAARIRPIVPVVVVAQAWRGGPQHQISRVLRACDILPDDLIHIAHAIGVKIRLYPHLTSPVASHRSAEGARAAAQRSGWKPPARWRARYMPTTHQFRTAEVWASVHRTGHLDAPSSSLAAARPPTPAAR